ncbi:hypothetical protein N9L47_06705 [Rhodobacteraceae bacterium]|nr:hypothetical protein [Paracoccaceae bacterium]
MVKSIWKRLRDFLSGRRLAEAIKRNDRAFDMLDQTVREVLKQ